MGTSTSRGSERTEARAVARVVAITGSYHHQGATNALLECVLNGAREAGADVQRIDLIDRHVEYCHNCRACTQAAGVQRGSCVIQDDVRSILDALDAADGIVLASPTNFNDVTAVTRTLLERMIGYGHWPFGQAAPQLRSSEARRPAVLITSSAAPGLMTRALAQPLRTLGRMAKLAGARPIGKLVFGLAGSPEPKLSPRLAARAGRLGAKLARRALLASRDTSASRNLPASRKA